MCVCVCTQCPKRSSVNTKHKQKLNIFSLQKKKCLPHTFTKTAGNFRKKRTNLENSHRIILRSVLISSIIALIRNISSIGPHTHTHRKLNKNSMFTSCTLYRVTRALCWLHSLFAEDSTYHMYSTPDGICQNSVIELATKIHETFISVL